LTSSDRIVNKRMAIHESDDSAWTYRLEDGICVDSMALLTAERFGLPSSVIERAKKLSEFIPGKVTGKLINDSSRGTSKKKQSNGDEINGSTLANEISFSEIASIAEELTLQPSYSIPPRFLPPASLDGKSSVYVLKLDMEPPLYYVGETDNFRNRIEQHRSKGGGKWLNLSAVVLPAEAEG